MATAAAAVFAYRELAAALGLSLDAGGLKLALGVAGAIAAGVAAYVIVIFLLKENELLMFARQLTGRGRGRKEEKP